MSDLYSTQCDLTSSQEQLALIEIQNKILAEQTTNVHEYKTLQELNDVRIEMPDIRSSNRFIQGLDNLKADNSQEVYLCIDPELRKESLKEGDFNVEDQDESQEYDIRRKIN